MPMKWWFENRHRIPFECEFVPPVVPSSEYLFQLFVFFVSYSSFQITLHSIWNENQNKVKHIEIVMKKKCETLLRRKYDKWINWIYFNFKKKIVHNLFVAWQLCVWLFHFLFWQFIIEMISFQFIFDYIFCWFHRWNVLETLYEFADTKSCNNIKHS